MSCGVGHSHGLDPALLWGWESQAAKDENGPQNREPPYATGKALKKKKKKKRPEEEKNIPLLNRLFTEMEKS